jgi:hypothetical protein
MRAFQSQGSTRIEPGAQAAVPVLASGLLLEGV